MRVLRWFTERTGSLGVIALIALVITVGVAPFGVIEKRHVDHFRQDAVRTTGTVVAQHDVDSRSGGTVVTVDYSVDGHAYQFTEGSTNEHIDHQREPVLYDPSHPSLAELADTDVSLSAEEYRLTFLFGGAFIALTLLGLMVTAFLRRRRRLSSPAPPNGAPSAPDGSSFDQPGS